MKTYTVVVARLVREEATFTIEGESEEEARDNSLIPLHPNNEDEYDLHWEPTKVENSWINSLTETESDNSNSDAVE